MQFLKYELFPRNHHHLPIFLSLIALFLALAFGTGMLVQQQTQIASNANQDQCIPLPPCYYNGTCPQITYNAATNGKIGATINHWCAPQNTQHCQQKTVCAVCPQGHICANNCHIETVCPSIYPSPNSDGDTPTPTPPGFLPCNDLDAKGVPNAQGYCPRGYVCNHLPQQGAPFGVCNPEQSPTPAPQQITPAPSTISPTQICHPAVMCPAAASGCYYAGGNTCSCGILICQNSGRTNDSNNSIQSPTQ